MAPGVAHSGALGPGPIVRLRARCAQRPRLHIEFGTGAQPRPQAPSTWRHGMAQVGLLPLV